jgi:hypothetical protein
MRSWQYAARPESETALNRVTALLRAGETRVALVGPPASGKTLLLHVLSERLGSGFASAYLPNPILGPDQVRAWLESCGEPMPADAGSSLEDLAQAHARRGPGLVLLIDDADDMPGAVAGAFGETLAHTDHQLRVVLAGADESRLEEVLARLGGHAERVAIGRATPRPGVPGAAPPTMRATGSHPPTPTAQPARTARTTTPAPPALGRPAAPRAREIPAIAPPIAVRAPEVQPNHVVARVPEASPPAHAVRAPAPPTPAASEPEPRRPTTAAPAHEIPSPRATTQGAETPTLIPARATALRPPLPRAPESAAPKEPAERAEAEAPAVAPPRRPTLRWAALAAGALLAVGAALALARLPDTGRARALLVASAAPDTSPDTGGASPAMAPPDAAEIAPRAAPEPKATALSAAAATATLAALPAVSAEPPQVLVNLNARPWARVAVDGRELGVTPLGNVPIVPGLHRFRAEMADGSVVEREVHIDGDSRRVTFP